MKKIITLFTILLTLTFIAGCSEEDCSLKDTTYEKFGFDSELGQCVVTTKIKEDVCGNKIAEDGETFCNCPKDVDKSHPINGCDGSKGDYLDMTCNEISKTCELQQNKKVVNENKELKFKNSYITIDGNFNLNRPFILNSLDENRIEAEFTVFNFQNPSKEISNLIVKDLAIENSAGVKLGSYTFNKKLDKIGSKTSKIKIELADIPQLESKETLKLKLDISYTLGYLNSSNEVYKSENKIETVQSSLGRWEIINPNFYEE